MKKLIVPVALALGIFSGMAAAGPRSGEVFYVEGRVVSAVPVYETTWYYDSRERERNRFDERCRVREVEVHRSGRNNAPAGAIIGGVIGAQVGAHAGNSSESAVAGAIAGGVIGSVIGQGVREPDTVHYRVERDCDTRYRREHRELIGYDVRYRYNGREFTIQTHDHPGRYIQLRVEVQPAVR
ncbi:glycine zipper 2TM domain-containing protein [Reinekea marinisedimentorum]|uniref:Uncharacterized protein YcfJ n=1 Tax=Reinekea marinisedimentorum TaxID=230495 RepID=A0A4R3I4K3_9GAMM|nr:glycine zipper 2TM domain-containing protein [Reinekea marinisedimentorum]TCS40013.1 uncharacterized protein YcfJ [Reinekea marinisedimentorum]